MKLIEDDVCRACWHGPHIPPCTVRDPKDINPYGHLCGCPEYVDLEAESKIIVRVKED